MTTPADIRDDGDNLAAREGQVADRLRRTTDDVTEPVAAGQLALSIPDGWDSSKCFERAVLDVLADMSPSDRAAARRAIAIVLDVSAERVNQCLRPDDRARFAASDMPKILCAIGSVEPANAVFRPTPIDGMPRHLTPCPRTTRVDDLPSDVLEATGAWGAFAGELAVALTVGVDAHRAKLVRLVRAHVQACLSIQAALEGRQG